MTRTIAVTSNPIKPKPRLMSSHSFCVERDLLAAPLILPRSCEGVVNESWPTDGGLGQPLRRFAPPPHKWGGPKFPHEWGGAFQSGSAPPAASPPPPHEWGGPKSHKWKGPPSFSL